MRKLLRSATVVLVLCMVAHTLAQGQAGSGSAGGGASGGKGQCHSVVCANGGIQDQNTCKCKCVVPWAGETCADLGGGGGNVLKAGSDFEVTQNPATMKFSKPVVFAGDLTIVGLAAFESQLKTPSENTAEALYVASNMEVTRSMDAMVAQIDGDTEMGGSVLSNEWMPMSRDLHIDGGASINGVVNVVSISSRVEEPEVPRKNGAGAATESNDHAVHVGNHLFVDNVLQTGVLTITNEEFSIEGQLGVTGTITADTFDSLFDNGQVDISGSLMVGTPVSNDTEHTLYVDTIRPFGLANTIPVVGTVKCTGAVDTHKVRAVIGKFLDANGIVIRSGNHINDTRSVLPSFEQDTVGPNVTASVPPVTSGNPAEPVTPPAAAMEEEIASSFTGAEGKLPSSGGGGGQDGQDYSDGPALLQVSEYFSADELEGAPSPSQAVAAAQTQSANSGMVGAQASATPDGQAAQEAESRAMEYGSFHYTKSYKENYCGGVITRATELNFPGARLFSLRHRATGLGNGLEHCSLFEDHDLCPAVIDITVFGETGAQFVITVHTGRLADGTFTYDVTPGVFAVKQDDESWEVAGLGDYAIYNFRFPRAFCRVQFRTSGTTAADIVATGTLFHLDDFYYDPFNATLTAPNGQGMPDAVLSDHETKLKTQDEKIVNRMHRAISDLAEIEMGSE